MKKTSILVSGLVALAAFLGAAAPAVAQDGRIHTAYAQISGQTSIPVGHMEYCQKRPYDCQPMAAAAPVALNDDLWRELQDVNNHFNTTITAVSDQDLYGVPEFWTIPASGYGDCEDFVLLKRRMLVDDGFSPADLLITVVLQPNGEGHAVLTVRTDRGDFILDNMRNKVMLWSDTEYTYLKRQASDNPGRWVRLQDGRAVAVGSVK